MKLIALGLLSAWASDTTKPTVKLVSPTDGQTVTGTIHLVSSASDNKGVQRVETWIDGKLAATEKVKPYDATFDSKTLKDGTHYVQAVVWDVSGLKGTGAMQTFKTANTAVPVPPPAPVPAPAPVPPPPPTTDETGWTDLTPKSDARVIYVSSSQGSDTNPGTMASPVKTASKAYALTRDGYPDQILFKRGDVFNGKPSNHNGRSSSDPFVLGAYGVGERPVFNIEPTGLAVDGCGKNKLIASLSFTVPKRATFPNSYGTADSRAVSCIWTNVSDIRFEDNKFEWFFEPFYWDGGGANGATHDIHGITLYRNVIANSYKTGGGVRAHKSEGIYVSKISNLTVDENLWYRNGWMPGQVERSYLNHNMYLNAVHGLKVRGNISALSSSLGIKINVNSGESASDIDISNNFIIGAANGITIISNDNLPLFTNVTMNDNVSTRIGAYADTDSALNQQQGLGARLRNIKNVTATGNIFVDKKFVNMGQSAMEVSGNSGTVSVKDNYVFNYTKSGAKISPSSFESVNWVEGPASELRDPLRTIDAYGGGGDGSGVLYAAIQKQRKGAWNEKYTAPVINDWFRAGIKKK